MTFFLTQQEALLSAPQLSWFFMCENLPSDTELSSVGQLMGSLSVRVERSPHRYPRRNLHRHFQEETGNFLLFSGVWLHMILFYFISTVTIVMHLLLLVVGALPNFWTWTWTWRILLLKCSTTVNITWWIIHEKTKFRLDAAATITPGIIKQKKLLWYERRDENWIAGNGLA